ncbi:hypothetical protein [Bosea sp. CS1GBMeth4]|uniref:hypothetical protein n=1 Tax=Bosea sp. CS1GBMeth4 TaxID=1892849 RepID=UPI0016446F81|nr:hypothetical protein [Bosea sp. CS1GBMeth4]
MISMAGAVSRGKVVPRRMHLLGWKSSTAGIASELAMSAPPLEAGIVLAPTEAANGASEGSADSAGATMFACKARIDVADDVNPGSPHDRRAD